MIALTNSHFYPSGDTRRQLYSIYSSAGNGFEAFITEDGTLTVATASKKEFLAVPLLISEGAPSLSDGQWHCVQVAVVLFHLVRCTVNIDRFVYFVL